MHPPDIMYHFFLLNLIFMSSISVATIDRDISPCNVEVDPEIKVVEMVPPRYPADVTDNVNGWVKLKFNVDSNGEIIEVIILDSKPVTSFGRSARRAVMKSKFSKSKLQRLRCGILIIEFILDE